MINGSKECSWSLLATSWKVDMLGYLFSLADGELHTAPSMATEDFADKSYTSHK